MEHEKVGILGNGILGKTQTKWMRNQGEKEVVIFDIDPEKTETEFLDFLECGTFVVCIPTNWNGSGLDTAEIESFIGMLGENRKTVIIRSTVPVGTCRELQDRFPMHDIYFAPEFLTEKTAKEDFEKAEVQIIGTKGELLGEGFFRRLFPGNLRCVTYEEAELVKLATNSFYATKIIFANALQTFCQAKGIDYLEVKKLLADNPRIGSTDTDNQGKDVHLRIAQDGYLGYGGKCLPKDTLQLAAHYSDTLPDSLNVPSMIAKANSFIRDGN